MTRQDRKTGAKVVLLVATALRHNQWDRLGQPRTLHGFRSAPAFFRAWWRSLARRLLAGLVAKAMWRAA